VAYLLKWEGLMDWDRSYINSKSASLDKHDFAML